MRKLLTSVLILLTIGCSTVKDVEIHNNPKPSPYVKIEKKPTKMKPLNGRFVNNNPFNIRRSTNKWRGKVQSEHEFELFCNAEYGIRAGMKLIKNYNSIYGITTIEHLINRFAPTCENNTEGYIKFICSMTGLERSESIDLHDADTLILVSKYMIQMESGKGIETAYLENVYNKFFKNEST